MLPSSDCAFLHRLPPPIPLPDQGRDIFGREKHGDYRDDMGGVGSMQRVNRTLYVGRIHEEPRLSGPQGNLGGRKTADGKPVTGSLMKRKGDDLSPTERVLWRHFSEWGEIERIRILHFRGCGFVTYVTEASAQFAKEAMMNQSMDHDEILNVRWATEDPNPQAKKEHAARLVAEGQKRMQERLTDEQRAVGDAVRRLEEDSRRLLGATAHNNKRRDRDDDEADADGEDEQADPARDEADDEALRLLEEENARGWAEIEAEQQAEQERASAVATAQAQPAPPPAKGLLSSDLLSGLQQLKAMQKPVQAAGGLNGLTAYGSDSEDE